MSWSDKYSHYIESHPKYQISLPSKGDIHNTESYIAIYAHTEILLSAHRLSPKISPLPLQNLGQHQKKQKRVYKESTRHMHTLLQLESILTTYGETGQSTQHLNS